MPTTITVQGQKCIAPARSSSELRALKKLLLPNHKLKKRTSYFTVLSSPARLQISHLLHAEKQLCVCDLARILGLSSSAVSQHLRKMHDCGLVDFRREGQTIFYFLIDPHFCNLLK